MLFCTETRNPEERLVEINERITNASNWIISIKAVLEIFRILVLTISRVCNWIILRSR